MIPYDTVLNLGPWRYAEYAGPKTPELRGPRRRGDRRGCGEILRYNCTRQSPKPTWLKQLRSTVGRPLEY